jgi:hypothetical protein
MSSGNYLTFMDKGTVIVLTLVVGLLLAVQALAWAFGYRKSVADEAGGA